MAVKWDIIDAMEAVEIEGHISSLTRRGLVNPAGTWNNNQILWACLNDPEVPRFGDFAPGNTNLICVSRKVKLLHNCTQKAEVICDYSTLPDSASFIFQGGTSLGGERTQVDRWGNEIVVAHQFPPDDPDYGDTPQYQGTDLDVLMPQTTLCATGQLPVDYPDLLSELWVGSMNATAWAGARPYQYLCTRCDFRGLDNGVGRQRRWLFTFEFQKRLTGWVPQTFFVDPRTGKPPRWLIPGVGYKSVDWYGLLDFNYLFGVR